MSARSAAAAAVSAFATVAFAGCITFEFQRDIIERQPDAEELASFTVGATHMGDVLAVLGAPIEVWEGAAGGAALAYGGLRSREWNVDVSVPVADSGSASLSYTDTTARTRGYMLLFDAEGHLEIVREGNLADLRRTYARRRPASIDDDAARSEQAPPAGAHPAGAP